MPNDNPTSADDEASNCFAQAVRIEEIIPAVARYLFTNDPSHPLADMPVAQLRLCLFLLDSALCPTISQTAEELRISVSATTQLADRLERAGLVERLSGIEARNATTNKKERDRRARYLRLTAQGYEWMLSRRELRQISACAVLERIPEAVRQRLLEGLELLLETSRPTVEEPEWRR